LLAQCLAAIAESFGDMVAVDRLALIQIGQGARDAQDPMEGASRKPKLLRGLLQESDAGLVRHGDLLQQATGAVGIGADALGAEGGETGALAVARSADTGANLAAAFAWSGQDQIGGGDGRHFDLQGAY
jgi:hypothetical protein